MSQEVTIRTSLQVNNGNLQYQSRPTGFVGDQTGVKGPCPGAMSVSVVGTDVDFSQLVTPAYCRIMNLDPTSYIEYGIMDHATHTFYPLGEVLPGESYVLRLSRNLHLDYGTGPGTSAAGSTTKLRLRASPQPITNALVEAFEK